MYFLRIRIVRHDFCPGRVSQIASPGVVGITFLIKHTSLKEFIQRAIAKYDALSSGRMPVACFNVFWKSVFMMLHSIVAHFS